MSFSSPNYLNLLYLLPIAVFLFWLILHHLDKVRSQFQMTQVARVGHVSNQFRYVRLAFLFVLGCGSLILALAEPQMEVTREEDIYRKVNVVFLLDTSLSMRAGSSLILSYLTDDPSNILFYLDYLEADLRPTFGTDIGAGFQNGLVLLEQEQGVDDSLQPEDVTFILISDGEDHGDQLREAVQKSIELGLRTYCVGLGTQLGGYIPIGERDGHTVFLVDEEGTQVLATFDEGTLRWVAAATGGRYYRSESGTELYENLNEILWNERHVIGRQTVTETASLYYWFIVTSFAALALFFID